MKYRIASDIVSCLVQCASIKHAFCLSCPPLHSRLKYLFGSSARNRWSIPAIPHISTPFITSQVRHIKLPVSVSRVPPAPGAAAAARRSSLQPRLSAGGAAAARCPVWLVGGGGRRPPPHCISVPAARRPRAKSPTAHRAPAETLAKLCRPDKTQPRLMFIETSDGGVHETKKFPRSRGHVDGRFVRAERLRAEGGAGRVGRPIRRRLSGGPAIGARRLLAGLQGSFRESAGV